MEPKDRIIVALDVPTLDAAESLVEQLGEHVGMFKVGLQLTTNVGVPTVIEFANVHGIQVFLDLKLHDIPNTVKGAAEAVAGKVAAFNVHASGGPDMMEAAVKAKGTSKVWAVTVLTSIDEQLSGRIYGAHPNLAVPRLAESARDSGVDGIICSPNEVQLLQERIRDLDFVTPGVRPTWAVKGDQSRVTTPEQAIKNGSTHLVIGRPITQPPEEIGSPTEAAKRIADEIGQAMAAIQEG